ncbi:MAG: hypothetical protein KA956_12495 [Pyrinomonadaceae bacterium]|nr:hypothetical protein [Pyrinomonadaceae bacterium]
MGRKILSVVVALVVAFAVMMIIEMLNSLQLTRPSAEVMADRAKLAEYMANGPARAYVVVLIGYFLASFAGGFIVTKMSHQVTQSMTLPIVIGAFLTLGMVANLFMLPGQPIWFAVLGLLIFIPTSLLGHRVAK